MHRFLVASSACALAAILFAAGVSFPLQTASAQVWENPDDPAGLVDDDLLHALRRLGLEGWWVKTSGIDPSVAFLQVSETSTQQEKVRGELFGLADAVVSDQAQLTLAGFQIRSAEIARGGLTDDLEALTARRTSIAARTRNEHVSVAKVRDRIEVAEASIATRLGEIDQQIDEYRDQISSRVDRRVELRAAARPIAERLIDMRARREVADVGLPVVVLDAYVSAGRSSQACAIDWAVLGGIGWIESHHGTYFGATVQSDGELSEPMVGIRLDGSRSAVITDSDGGRLDGDTAYDRAVGPMQFIPSTWSRHAVDGNGDEITNPQNLHDAAATAAAYLCRVGGNSASTRTRLLGYNNSNTYVDDVLATAAALRRTELPTITGARD